VRDPAEGLRPEAVNGFWRWWDSTKDAIAAAIADGSLGNSPLVGDISSAIRGLHPDFAWELGPGRESKHNLTVTAEGNLELRRLTQHWLASAPPPDQTWEYYASRQASPPLGLEIGGKRFAPEDFRVAFVYDQARERFDVELYHPQFKKADENIVRQVVFLTLDESLGEDDVERWIGELDPATSMPSNAVSLTDFVSVVDDARKNVKGEWFSLGQGQSRDGRPVFVTVNTALKQIDHLDYVFHVAVVIALREPDANGLPASAEGQQLDQAEDRLLAALGENAVHIGRVTWAGRREIHLFAKDPASAAAVLAAWTEEVRPWSATHTFAYDPTWNASKQGIYAALAPRR
jgi:hypothetical protein